MGRSFRARRKRDNTCFGFKKNGKCAFGDTCKFSHDIRVDTRGDGEQTEANRMLMEENEPLEKLQVSTSFFPLHLLDDVQNQEPLENVEGRLNLHGTVFDTGSCFVDETGQQKLMRSTRQLDHVLIMRPKPYEQRQFIQYFIPVKYEGEQEPGAEVLVEDLCVHFHSNGVALLQLSPFHAALAKTRRVTKIDFTILDPQASKRRERKTKHSMSQQENATSPGLTQNDAVDETGSKRVSGDKSGWGRKYGSVHEFKVSGKSKKGGLFLVETHTVCNIYCDDGTCFTVRSNLRGRLFEINTALIEQPSLIYEKNCYLIILYPKKEELNEMKKTMLSKEAYLHHLNATPSPTVHSA